MPLGTLDKTDFPQLQKLLLDFIDLTLDCPTAWLLRHKALVRDLVAIYRTGDKGVPESLLHQSPNPDSNSQSTKAQFRSCALPQMPTLIPDSWSRTWVWIPTAEGII